MNDAAEFNTSRLVLLSDWAPGTLALVALISLAVLALAWHNVRAQPPFRRNVLLALRGAAVLALFTVFLEPGLRLENVTRVRNHLVVMVDASRSMDLPGYGDTTRLAGVQQALTRASGTLETWRTAHSIDFYAVTDHARPVGRPEEITASGDATRLATGLADLAARHRPDELAGVLLFSDGADNGALGAFGPGKELPATVRDAVLRLGAPIHTYFTGPDEPVKDVAITDVQYDEFAFVHNAVSIEADISIQGYDELSLPVTLRRDDALLGTRVLQVEKGPDGNAHSHFKFDFVPDKTGKAIFTLEVGTAPGEQITVNNQAAVRGAHHPRQDPRAAGRRPAELGPAVPAAAPEEEPQRRSDQLLHPAHQFEHHDRQSQSELSLIPFPTEELFKEQLGSFDLIIFQNFTYRGYNMDAYLPLIRDFVRNGGGFVMVGGDLSYTNGGYAGTAIEEFLPMNLRAGRGELSTEPFSPVLTEAGRRHPVTSLSVVPEDNTTLWAGLPVLNGFNRVGALRPGAVVLLETAAPERAPVVVAHEFGEGRVLALTTDSTWHWDLHAAESGDNRHYYKFWGNAIRWLIKDPALQPVRIQADRDRYPLGTEATLTVRVSGRDSLPAAGADVVVDIERVTLDADGRTQTVPVNHQAGTTNEQGELVLRFAPPGDGGYRARARAQRRDERGQRRGPLHRGGRSGRTSGDPRTPGDVGGARRSLRRTSADAERRARRPRTARAAGLPRQSPQGRPPVVERLVVVARHPLPERGVVPAPPVGPALTGAVSGRTALPSRGTCRRGRGR
jgi:uncharacterized membrane protein